MVTTKNKTETKKVTVNLPTETIERIREIADKHGLTMTEAIRRAIITESYLEKQIAEGNKILLEKPDQTYTELVFR
ncbi:MAG: ribbon-helix-helix protein, CopG family [Halothece sp.]